MKSFNKFINESSFTDYEYGLHIQDAKFNQQGVLVEYTAKSIVNDKIVQGAVWDTLASNIAKHLGIKNIAKDFINSSEDKTVLFTEVEENINHQYFVAVSGKRFMVPKEINRVL